MFLLFTLAQKYPERQQLFKRSFLRFIENSDIEEDVKYKEEERNTVRSFFFVGDRNYFVTVFF